MAVTNDKIFTELMEVSKAVAGIVPVVTDLKKAVITGNGVPGLLQRVQFIEDCHKTESDAATEKKKTIKDVKDKRQEFSSKVILILITMVVSNVGVLLFAILK